MKDFLVVFHLRNQAGWFSRGRQKLFDTYPECLHWAKEEKEYYKRSKEDYRVSIYCLVVKTHEETHKLVTVRLPPGELHDSPSMPDPHA